MFNWYAALDSVNKRIAELETRISVLRAELQRADGQVAKTIAQRILLIRERELERAKVQMEFIEHKIATGRLNAPTTLLTTFTPFRPPRAYLLPVDHPSPPGSRDASTGVSRKETCWATDAGD
jgi:hypothetical protein